MRAKYTRVRLSVVGPFLVYFLLFLLWFSYWQHAPHSAPARVLGVVFGAITLVLAMIATIGGFFLPFGRAGIVGAIVKTAIELYQTFIAKDSVKPEVQATKQRRMLSPVARPDLEITKTLKDGTPVRGACPVCEVEFSTEAFDRDPIYPHSATLDRWYEEHFASHIEES